jgi:uncharacterized cupredoxin-like copper-binding protein
VQLVSIVSRVGAVAVLVAAVAGCGGAELAPHGASVVRVGERDFAISAPKLVAAGDTVLRVRNSGPDDHELIVVRVGRGPLPLRGDGLTVDEEGMERAEAGVLEPGDPHTVRYLSVHLVPGRYVLLCNMSGHYLGGMHAVLVVK